MHFHNIVPVKDFEEHDRQRRSQHRRSERSATTAHTAEFPHSLGEIIRRSSAEPDALTPPRTQSSFTFGSLPILNQSRSNTEPSKRQAMTSEVEHNPTRLPHPSEEPNDTDNSDLSSHEELPHGKRSAAADHESDGEHETAPASRRPARRSTSRRPVVYRKKGPPDKRD